MLECFDFVVFFFNSLHILTLFYFSALSFHISDLNTQMKRVTSNINTTVDGRNPAPVDTVLFTGFCTFQVFPGGAGFLPSKVSIIHVLHVYLFYPYIIDKKIIDNSRKKNMYPP